MPKFAFRAECQHDVEVLKDLIARSDHDATFDTVKMEAGGFPIPDVGGIVDYPASFTELLATMMAVPDGHVMCETLTATPDVVAEIEADPRKALMLEREYGRVSGGRTG